MGGFYQLSPLSGTSQYLDLGKRGVSLNLKLSVQHEADKEYVCYR